MGNSTAKEIKVATLNYSGITLSPFEFVSQDNKQEMKFINAIYIRLFYRQRYSKIYRQSFNNLKDDNAFDEQHISVAQEQLKKLADDIKKNTKKEVQWLRDLQQKLRDSVEKKNKIKEQLDTMTKIQNQLNATKLAKLQQKKRALQTLDQGIEQLKKQINNKPLLKWRIGSIDRRMHKERYSPLYRQDVGIHNGIRFMKRGQVQSSNLNDELSQNFFSLWKQQFKTNSKYVKFEKEPTEQQKNECCLFDYLIFKTLVQYCYLTKNRGKYPHYISTAWRAQIMDRNQDMKKDAANINAWNEEIEAVKMYEQLLERFFKKPYLKQQKKVKRVLEIYKEHDIVFLQDVSQELINSLKNERNINIITAEEGDSAILIKQDKFDVLYDEKKVLKDMGTSSLGHIINQTAFYYNTIKDKQIKTTAVCFVDDFVLVSLRLSSDKTYGQQQVKKALKHFEKLNKGLGRLNIIIGGDFNKYINDKDKPTPQVSGLHIYPLEQINTTKKKRSWLQPQIEKSDNSDFSCRDFLLSSKKLHKQKIITTDPGIFKALPDLLPTEGHPFDHFVVSASIFL